MKGLFLAAIVVLLFGCGTTEKLVSPKQVIISIPEIKDSLSARTDKYIKVLQALTIPDTFRIKAEKTIYNKKGDSIKVKLEYSPKRNKFYIDIPKYSVDTTIMDTSIITLKNTSAPEKLGYITYGLILSIIILIVIKNWRK